MSYEVINPSSEIPFVLSVPHCGIAIPSNIRSSYVPEKIGFIDDTDWYVDRLYDFACEMGITMIKAKYSRWVIDLNRNAHDKPLYDDGRVITALTPVSDFNGESIYEHSEPDSAEIQRRIDSYYQPYYDKIGELLEERRSKYDHVLFFDAHSIRQYVPGIRDQAFPDLILGDVDGASADERLIEAAEKILTNSTYSFQHNDPFKGGNLTRSFGRPQNGIHALQLEMSKILYMDDREVLYNDDRATKVRGLLRSLFEQLLEGLQKLNHQ